MSDKPRVGSYAHGLAYPNKLSIYNADYNSLPPYQRELYLDEPWFVDRGMETLRAFKTWQEAMDFLRDELAKASPMEVS